MACSWSKSKIRCLGLHEFEGDCRNIWNVGGNIENDDKYFEEEEYWTEDEKKHISQNPLRQHKILIYAKI